MKLTPTAVQKYINYGLLAVISFEIFIILIYLGSILLTGKVYRPFDVDGILTIPSIWQAVQLFAIGFISLMVPIVKRNYKAPPSRLFLFTIGGLLLYASVDEMFKIHLYLPSLIPHQDSHYWFKIFYFFVALMIPLAFYRDFRALWRFYRKETFIALLGMATFILGAYVTEIFKHELLEPLLAKIFKNGDFMAFFIEKLRSSVEEFGEMLGQSIILYGMLLFLAKTSVKSSHEQTD